MHAHPHAHAPDAGSASVREPAAAGRRGQVLEGRDVTRDVDERADVVVVGSGAGGAVAAAELAEAGLDVVLLEEGGLYITRDFELDPGAMVRKVYRNAGASVVMGTPKTLFSEGRCVGGSTVINGAISWRTPERVLARWSDEFGLEAIDVDSMAPTFAKIEERIGIAHPRPDSIAGSATVLKRGADALGWRLEPVRRSARDCVGSNQCAFGCPTGAKQSTLLSYVPRALAAGARLYADAHMTRVRTHDDRAVGVDAVVTCRETGRRRRLRVTADAVVLACGAIQTPLVLARHGFGRTSPWLGRNLLLHPNLKAYGVFPYEVRAWEGTHQAWKIYEFLEEGLDLSAIYVPPPVVAMSLPYIGNRGLEVVRSVDRMIMGGILLEDSTSGSVRPAWGLDGLARYDVTAGDVERLKLGISRLAEAFFAAGAERVHLPFHGLTEVRSADELGRITDPSVQAKHITELFTVHLMGTCRMGASSGEGVTDAWGRVWDVPGLHVADASLFPTGLGVNPQVTVMALASRVARRLVETRARWNVRPRAA